MPVPSTLFEIRSFGSTALAFETVKLGTVNLHSNLHPIAGLADLHRLLPVKAAGSPRA